MAKRTTKSSARVGKRQGSRSGSAASPGAQLGTLKFENVYQVGGIQTARLDHPQPNGSPGCRVAYVNTGGGLRFTVALDRGGDIVEASYNQYSLTYLTPNGYKPPNVAYHREYGWLDGWPGGLVTTCGPGYIGHPRDEGDVRVGLHGHYSNTPAALEMVLNPDPHRGRREMLLSMVIRDTRMFGPNVEVRRQIQCVLGQPQIKIYDQVTNRGNAAVPHHWLYHCNFGYPLLDKGAKFVYRGKGSVFPVPDRAPSDATLNRLKRATDPIPEHVGNGERVVFVDVKPDGQGINHVGLINPKLKLGVELAYPAECLPRLANWQHFGQGGSYVTGIEPFSGSLLGSAGDSDKKAVAQQLKPGQTRNYRLTIKVHTGPAELNQLMRYDGPLKS